MFFFTSLSEKQAWKNPYKTFVNRWEMWFTAPGNKGENVEWNRDQMKDVKDTLSNRIEKLQRIPALEKKLQTQTCQHNGDLGCYGFQSHLRVKSMATWDYSDFWQGLQSCTLKSSRDSWEYITLPFSLNRQFARSCKLSLERSSRSSEWYLVE